jgi:hypothetical protein
MLWRQVSLMLFGGRSKKSFDSVPLETPQHNFHLKNLVKAMDELRLA